MSKTILCLCLCFVLIHSQITLLKSSDKKENPKPTKGKKQFLISQTIVTSMNIGSSDYQDTPSSRTKQSKKITEEVAGIILSFKNGNSYDGLFSTVEQKSKDDSVVLTFVANANSQKAVLQALRGTYQKPDADLQLFIGQIQKLGKTCPQCIVFNWECSSGYSYKQFTQGSKYVFGLLKIIIKRGYLAMFSDFSLKALINQWDEQILGPNPYVQIGQTNTGIKMKFDRNILSRSPSSQLQAVAKLAASDEIFINVLGGTIKYSVDSRRQPTDKYQLQVLSIADNFEAPSSNLELKLDRYTGIACHTLLSYKSGGKIITSMGHWIQLMKIDTTPQKLFEVAKNIYGEKQYARIRNDYQSLKTDSEKAAYIQTNSRNFIQNQSPGANSVLQGAV